MTKELSPAELQGRLNSIAGELKKTLTGEMDVHLTRARLFAQAHSEHAGAGRDGNFRPWVEEHTDFSYSTAKRYVQFWQRVGTKVAHDEPLIDQATMFHIGHSATPDKAVDEILKKAKSERMTGRDAKEITAKHMPAKPAAETDECPTCGAKIKVTSKAAQIAAVVKHYQTLHPQYRGDKAGKQKINARLREGYSVDELCQAIDGNHVSPFHCGENKDGTKHHGMGVIFRDGDQVAKFIEMAKTPPKVMTERTRRNVRAGQEFMELDIPGG